jgi:nucleoside-diphosphate-sugar epimerase
VIHCAGLAHQFGKARDEDFWNVNVEGTKNLAHLAEKLKAKQFILISSVSVYGKQSFEKKDKNRQPLDENAEYNPDGAYAKSKIESEKAAIRLCEKNGIPITVLRLSTVIGEGDPGNTSRLIETINKNRFVWIGNGRNRKSLIYKNDIADACVKILENKKNETEIFNITAEPLEMREIVSEIALSLGKKIPKIHIPAKLLELVFWLNKKSLQFSKISSLSGTIEKWLSEDVFSGDKIAGKYGFRPKTPVRKALKRQVRAYKKEINIQVKD